MAAAPRRPLTRPGLDWRTLPIGPTEAFVLSRLDGHADVAQIALTTGMSELDVESILDRLESLGAVSFRNEGFSPPKAPEVVPRPMPSSEPAAPKDPPNFGRPAATPQPIIRPTNAPPTYDVALLDEPAELDVPMKARILELEARLARGTHYDILGVSVTAERAEIKKAYFSLIQQFHTDRHFGKELGIFRSKIEKISSALTKAQDTLSRAKTRAEYDAYLASRAETRGLRDSLPPTGVPPREPDEPSLHTAVIPRAPAAPVIEGTEQAQYDARPIERDESDDRPSSDPAAGRRLLARKLGFRQGDAKTAGSPSTLPPSDREAARDRLTRELKNRETKATDPSAAAHYVAMADAARAGRDFGSVVNALRIAAGLAPNDATIRDALLAATLEADRELADKFAQQAQYEQRDGHYDRATRSYERAARGKESSGHVEEAARFYHEAAICAAKEGTAIKRIAELARRAVAMNGKKVEYRLDLARAYERMGMHSSAQGEVARALELEPDNEAAKLLQKQLR